MSRMTTLHAGPLPLSFFFFSLRIHGHCARKYAYVIQLRASTNNKVRGVQESPPLRVLWLSLPLPDGAVARLHPGACTAAAAAAPALLARQGALAVLRVPTVVAPKH